MKLPDTSRLTFDEKKHAYKLDGKLLSGVTTVISETSSKSNLIQWAANMAVDHIKNEFDTIVFPSKEDDGIEHMDCSYKELYQLLEQARTAHARKRDGAATKGTDTHAIVEEYINACITYPHCNGKPIPADTSIGSDWRAIKPFVDWACSTNITFIAAEQRLYSETHGYAGTCDFIAMIDGKLTIGDLKTFPKMWSADAFIQMGAYSLAWKELTSTQPAQSVVVKMCDPNDERLKKYGGKAFAVYPRYALEEDEQMFLTRLKMYRYNENFVSPKD